MPVSSFSFVRRFLELFELAQYEDAALIAARAPRGVLRNIDTMEMFKGGNSTCTVIRALIMLISSKDEISLTQSTETIPETQSDHKRKGHPCECS